MIRTALTLLFAATALATAEPPEKPKTTTVELNGQSFTLPEGFTIELVAGPPLVKRPISGAFDDHGHLYVSDSSGTNDKVQVQLAEKPHRVLRLTDTRGAGKFDTATVFADKLMFPEGTMWLDGSLYVSAPPSIWKLTDTTGNGVADKREEWLKAKTLTGCANDLHGPYKGPDGWIYWCKGAFAEQTWERPGKPPFVTRAAHVFRARPDGTGIEPVMTGGMDNPVAVAFTPGGERIVCGTFFVHPAGGQRDGLLHAVYGGVYGKDHDVIYNHPWTAPSLMPVMTHMGPAAPAKVIRYESNAFGDDYKDNLLVAHFNLHKVSRHVLIPDGATFKTMDEDFLVSSNIDFHPTDVIEDGDGSLLVIDTGGWYKLCCPTSQFHKPDVLGAIYRVRRKDAKTVDDPLGLKVRANQISLDDPRPAVRRHAVEEGAKYTGRGAEEIAYVIKSGVLAEARRNGIWFGCRIDDAKAREAIRTALKDDDESVRQVAIHAAALWHDRGALRDLIDLLKSPSVQNRRAAAEALGRIGDTAAVPALLAAVGQPCDRVLEHSLTYALIEIGNRESLAAGCHNNNPRVRRAAMTALDQMPGGHIDAAPVIAELSATDPALRETTWWIAGHHPEWGDQIAGVLRERIRANLSSVEREDLAHQLARFAKSLAIQKLLADELDDAGGRRLALLAIGLANVRPAPEPWIAAVAHHLSEARDETLGDVVRTARALNVPKPKAAALTKALLAIADNSAISKAVRLDALAAIPGGPGQLLAPRFEFLRELLRPDLPTTSRGAAADVLSRSKLTKQQLLTLCDAVTEAGPVEADRLLDAFQQSTDETVGLSLVTALKASGRGSLRAATLRPRLAKFGPAVQKQAEELYAALNADEALQRAKLEALLTEVHNGDIRRGQSVFHGQKAACSSCHSVGYVGGKLGPDLTKIGSIRTERDLLESIVFPSASFVRSYEPFMVSTKSGRQFNGLIKKDAADEIIIATGADQEVHVPRADVDEVQPSTVSVMPAGLDQQLSKQDLADLIAFLKACK
jgi:putative membrane-bound dehydrogenase-like protein